jgi:aminoglycoside 6'-N-acetyltransferase I
MLEKIMEIQNEDIDDLVKMGLGLWSEHTEDDMRKSFLKALSSDNEIFFVNKVGDEYTGFISVSIRNDYVEGSSSRPVGYVEGIYVKPEFRNKGIAGRLIKKGEEWARSRGCSQMGSDVEMNNDISSIFHLKVGFKEANRMICFIKDIQG